MKAISMLITILFGMAGAMQAAVVLSTGTLVASFNGGTASDTVTGTSGPSGDHNQDGLVINGMPPAQQWVNVTSSGTGSGSGTDSSSGNAITFNFNLNNADTGGESPGGFSSGDLRDNTWRMLAPSFGTTGASGGNSWATHPGFISWELTGLQANTAYDLIFYGGDPNRPAAISITSFTGTTDTEGDVNFTSVTSNGSGVISGQWLQPTTGGAISNFGGVQVALVPEPSTLALLGLSSLFLLRRRR